MAHTHVRSAAAALVESRRAALPAAAPPRKREKFHDKSITFAREYLKESPALFQKHPQHQREHARSPCSLEDVGDEPPGNVISQVNRRCSPHLPNNQPQRHGDTEKKEMR